MIHDAARLIFWRYLTKVIARTPLVITSGLTASAGFFYFLAARRQMRLVSSELAACRLLEGRQEWLILLGFAVTRIRTWVKMSYLSRLNSANIDRYIRVDGLEHLENALDRGKGVILLNPHFGPFLLAMAGLGHRNYKVNQLALQGESPYRKRKPLQNKVYEAAYNAMEKQLPATFINATENKMSLRAVLKALGKNELVLFASTGRGGKTWSPVTFLNRPCLLNEMPFRLAIKTGAVLLPVFVFDQKPLARVVISEAITESENTSAEDMLKAYAGVLEDTVRSAPEHFAYYLFEMRKNAMLDDHPFFQDYGIVRPPKG